MLGQQTRLKSNHKRSHGKQIDSLYEIEIEN